MQQLSLMQPTGRVDVNSNSTGLPPNFGQEKTKKSEKAKYSNFLLQAGDYFKDLQFLQL
jgi:hypothetical protein